MSVYSGSRPRCVHVLLWDSLCTNSDTALTSTLLSLLQQQAAKLGCTVDTLTLSREQKAGADERIRKLGLQDKITVHLLDYRNLPRSFEHQFDAFISMEMIEVGGGGSVWVCEMELMLRFFGSTRVRSGCLRTSRS